VNPQLLFFVNLPGLLIILYINKIKIINKNTSNIKKITSRMYYIDIVPHYCIELVKECKYETGLILLKLSFTRRHIVASIY
jgi:hypothetical protein